MGWKDILKPIRDRLDDLLPPNNADEKERLKRQQQDALKGFKYFESFDDLEAWQVDEVDPIQISNTPLLQREPPRGWVPTAQVTLIHDFAGNYHDYESSQGLDVDSECYSCEYLQFVDTFVYFSHRLVTIPPPSWTNSLHRQGVKSLGTFIVEPGSLHVERILQTETREDGEEKCPQDFIIAKQLTRIAAAYGFDGWLINIEKTFPSHVWDLEKLKGFLVQLRREMGQAGSVIWYDALTINNKVNYQNSLTPENVPFFQASGGLLTNYCWDQDKLCDTLHLAKQMKLSKSQVAFGVDVWAQCRQPQEHPRITWPPADGGGTRTGLAVSVISSDLMTVGIFGPAMPYEHFGRHGRAVDRAIWEALPLPKDLVCDCGKDARKFHPENQRDPIIAFAEHYDAGSKDYFYTNFERAFAKRSPTGGIRAQLGAQSVSPNLPISPISDLEHFTKSAQHYCARTLDNPSRLLITTKAFPASMNSENEITYAPTANVTKVPGSPYLPTGYSPYTPLFRLALDCTKPLYVRIKFRALLPYRPALPIAEAGFLFITYEDFTQRVLRDKRTTDDGRMLVDEIIPPRANNASPSQSGDPPSHFNTNRITGLNIRLDAFDPTLLPSVDLLEIYEICIQPANSATRRYSIRDVHVEDRGRGELQHMRLCWQVREQVSAMRECPAERPRLVDGSLDQRPWSAATGPFSYFRVRVDGEEIGRAYALEFVLPDLLRERLRRGEECSVRIVGVTFWGEEWESEVVELPDLARDWEMVG